MAMRGVTSLNINGRPHPVNVYVTADKPIIWVTMLGTDYNNWALVHIREGKYVSTAVASRNPNFGPEFDKYVRSVLDKNRLPDDFYSVRTNDCPDTTQRIAVGFCVVGAGWYVMDQYMPDFLLLINGAVMTAVKHFSSIASSFPIEGKDTNDSSLETRPHSGTMGAVEKQAAGNEDKDTRDIVIEKN
ncbi:hypothetical protein MTO96_022030 [Rhipicephalus appendiculatus]